MVSLVQLMPERFQLLEVVLLFICKVLDIVECWNVMAAQRHSVVFCSVILDCRANIHCFSVTIVPHKIVVNTPVDAE